MDPKVSAPQRGVRETPVEEITNQRLRCFYSGFERQPEALNKEDALQFYSTVEALFTQVAVIPFRFPTLLESKEQLHEFLKEKSQAYSAALDKLRNVVQMELRILSHTTSSPDPKASGKQYLAGRLTKKKSLHSTAAAARSAAGTVSIGWRERETREGLRCYALVGRAGVSQFEQTIKSLAPEKGINILVSGPWPATEFIE